MGPLHGVRVVEIASLAPAPFACMVLSDLGADVLRVDRPTSVGREAAIDPLGRGRRSIGLNLKDPAGVEVLLRLLDTADVLIEGFRPGVTERLGFGPDICLERNRGLVYGRMTGWGQEGPMAQMAGHDINYIAIAGALDPIGRAGERPLPPLNLVGDFGGGGMLLAVGVLAALFERSRSGRGQVVDAAMVDGAALLTSFIHGMRGQGLWQDARGTNLLDGGAPFYDTYETADGLHMSVGALEPQFYAALLRGLGLEGEDLPAQNDQARWPEMRARFTEVFKAKTRDEWTRIFDGTDACVAPVLGLGEAPAHPHATARTGFVDVGGLTQPAPAPRFSRTAAETPAPPVRPGEHTEAALAEIGLSAAEIADLRERGAVA
ncbi:CaiB/BaiF CoA-transferase family protein [Actinoallomurus bryophytorum]|uniref:Alpha-methylacyl-CoA racemase n=1 Tax=Actinoallomurus bryophytorum TaxID=1490222 RepID=A0A543CND7_9ACTN|nr:CaiB/BaiF CoA-transferase family protein [Actinoallomurus bryophytorum]TQL98593.1 alpha-methylacyl-CoA racemase [Actinoallomurus bryophytorum]